jgi:hypothetical protein
MKDEGCRAIKGQATYWAAGAQVVEMEINNQPVTL